MNCPNPFAFVVQSLANTRLASAPSAPHPRRSVSDSEVNAIRTRRQQGEKRLDLAKEFNVSLAAVRAYCEGRRRRQPESTA